MNHVILIGNLTRDPEGGQTQQGITWCRFTLAVQRRFSDATGKREADFLSVVCWRQLAENCIRYLHKGSKAGISGRIEVRPYEDVNGQKRTSIEIIADSVEFLSPTER